MQKVTFHLLFAGIPFSVHGADLFIFFGVLWMAMLVDCLRFNKRLPWKQKFLWILVLIFIAPVGTILYFLIAFLGRLFTPKEQHKHNTKMQEETYSGYEQGYRHEQQPTYQPPQQSHLAIKEDVQEGSSFPLYEQPQASYPEGNE
jgi:hypothetical protein